MALGSWRCGSGDMILLRHKAGIGICQCRRKEAGCYQWGVSLESPRTGHGQETFRGEVVPGSRTM